MNHLPEYFLADLSPETLLQPGLITEACQTLKRNREQYLLPQSTDNLVRILANLGEQWCQPDFPFRQRVLQACPEKTGFSRATLERGIDFFFSRLTVANLKALMRQELGHEHRLDQWTASEIEQRQNRLALVRGPELLVHLTAGNLPSPAWMSLILGLLTRSAQFLKPASDTSYLPLMLAHSLYEIAPKLASCIEIAAWPGGTHDLENVLFSEADCVTVTGSDQTLKAVQARLQPKTRFLGYGHRVSFAFVTSKALAQDGTSCIAKAAADDIAAWDQHGCLSPHVIYVENNPANPAEAFAEQLANALANVEEREPRAVLSTEASAVIASRRSFYEIRAAFSPATLCWFSKNSTAWSVVFEADPLFQISCLNRFIYVKGVPQLSEALQAAEAVRHHTSTVGLAAVQSEVRTLAAEIARWGATRVCPLGQMQTPPLTWRHDGRPALGDLITWTDLET
ncbi:MAG TPA: acyl-CoA reductase [Candidatus Paceibacterota bacterium]|nr:acyl-CoA reductase [Candidatus Paceibacterota bacterium]HSA01771.1 acyl-CoA reductase [Candidatus Paceibacterota bacterium]